MTQRAEEFMDEWLQANVADKTLHPRATVAGLTRRCASDARKAGIPLEELKAVVADIAEAITDELNLKNLKAAP